jgi:transcriptional regulator with XRE-family HTH domain
MSNYAERLDKSLAHQIRVELADRGITQKALAETMGIAESTLSHYVMNHRKMNMAMFLRLAQALDATPSELLGRAEERLASQDGSSAPGNP